LTDQVKTKRNFLDSAIAVTAVAMVLYHLVYTQYLWQGALEHQAFHLGFALTLVFLTSMRAAKSRKFWPYFLVLIAGGLLITAYIRLNISHLQEITGLPGTLEIVLGIILILVVVEATRQAWGLILPTIAVVFILYFLFGKYAPWGLGHTGFRLSYIVSVLGIGLSGTFGFLLGISANYVFLFIVFGSILQVTGASQFVLEVGKVVSRYLAGGPAQIANISSGMIGATTGSPIANVLVTGSFTIPLMKKTGYKPEVAGGIEAAASTGGQIMPPVMGATAFIMAAILGVSYAEVMIAAIVPAVLYYFGVGLGIQVTAWKNNMTSYRVPVDGRIILSRAPVFLIPLIVLTVLLLMRLSPVYAAFYAIVAVLFLAFLRKETRPSWSELVNTVSAGAVAGAKMAVVLSCVGIMSQVLYSTALGVKFTNLVQELSGDNLLPAVFLTMVVSLILGCGVPGTAAYILVASVSVPVLIGMGVMPMAAHFFAFYFAILSAVTPPVAVAAMPASALAKADFWKTGLNAFMFAIGGFIVPFLIIYNPSYLLGQTDAGVLSIILSLTASVALVTSIIAVMHGFFLVKMGLSGRTAYALSTVSLFAYVLTGYYAWFIAGIMLLVLLTGLQWRARRNSAAQTLPLADGMAEIPNE